MRKQLLYVCPLLLLASAAWGSTCATSATLDTYLVSGFSCSIDDLLFSNFNYYAPTGLPTAASIGVQPVDMSGDIGFDFFGAFVSSMNMSEDATLGYTITATGSNTMSGDTVSIVSGAAAPGTNATATILEGICVPAPGSNGACNKSYSLDVSDNGTGGNVQSDSVTFATAATSQTVFKNIITQGPTNGSGTAGISEFENVTMTTPGGGGSPGGGSTPEPGSLLTLGSGLIGTSLLLRRRARKG